jgi:F-type H+-transporting ATPase subunit b
MELFTPEIGLICWMLIAFLAVFFLLAKFAWPSIIKGVDERGQFIDNALHSAKEANEQLAGIKAEGERLMAEARNHQLDLLKEASDMRNKLLKEAKEQAVVEAEKVIQDARAVIQKEKDEAMKEIRLQIAELSVDIAEKIIRRQLDEKAVRMDLIDKLLNEVKN